MLYPLLRIVLNIKTWNANCLQLRILLVIIIPLTNSHERLSHMMMKKAAVTALLSAFGVAASNAQAADTELNI